MNKDPFEAHEYSGRRFPKGQFSQWWRVRRGRAKISLGTGGILIVLLLAGYMLLFGSPASSSQPVSAATVAHTVAANASVQTVAAKTKCQAVNKNPWCYNFVHGLLIYHPHTTFCHYFACVSDFWKATRGYVVECWNGKYSHSGGRRGVCAHDKNVRRTLYS